MSLNQWAGFLLLVGSVLSGVAAGQEVRTTEVEGWGTLFDPEGDSRVATRNGLLELSVPGVYRDLWTEGRVNAPRVLTPAQGDFSMTVKVAAVGPSGTVLAPDRPAAARWSAQSATLLVWHDENNFVRLERMASPTKHFWHYNTYDRGIRAIKQSGPVKPDLATHLWIARKQGVFHAGYRQDGETTWTRLETHRLALPDRVMVGVSLVNSTNQPFTARFEDFRLGEAK